MSTDTEVRTGTYEGMFLVTQAAAAAFGECVEHINHLFERANATVIAMQKWDERRLSYEMDKQKRGVYILAYFTCPTDMVAHLERDAVISDKIMRLLVTTADHLTEEEIASHDDRKGLDTEAKLRAEQGAAEDTAKTSTVRLGAPVKEEAPAPAAEAAPEPAAEPAEGDAEAPAAE
jgi:ribosomal protein S6